MGIKHRTAMIQGSISLLSLDLKNVRPSLFLMDKGPKKPEMKKMVDMTNISKIKNRMPER
jgi:hypothetical protein